MRMRLNAPLILASYLIFLSPSGFVKAQSDPADQLIGSRLASLSAPNGGNPSVRGQDGTRGPQQKAPLRPTDTTVCDVVKHAETFVGKLVRFHAEFLSDGMHGSALIDKKCKGGIVPWTSEEVDKHADVKELDRALSQGNMGTMDKKITATFTGRFQCKPSCSAFGGRILEIEQISDLQVTMIQTKLK